LLYALSGDAPPGLVPRLSKNEPRPLACWTACPSPAHCRPGSAPKTLTSTLRRTHAPGSWGPLGVYRNQDQDWHEHPQIGTAGVRHPALYIGGRCDPAVLFGKLEPMEAAVPNLRRIVLLPNCGHWTQQERPGDVNDELLAFLQREQRS
jgi:pimeloyl-ACP methyl ester carboxylesterase